MVMSIKIENVLISRQDAGHLISDFYRAIGLTDNKMMALREGIEEMPSAQATKVSCLLRDCKYNQDSICTKDEITLYESHCCDGGCDDGWEIRETEPSEDQTGWSSCNDAFPTTPDEKLVQRENGTMAIAYYDDPGWTIWNSEERCFHEIGDVIAWRDLPDPFVER